MFHRKFHLLFLSSVLLLSSKAHALINGKPLINTPDVVRIVFTNGWMCSGVYVDPFTVLTAAHCLVSEEKDQLKVDKLLSEDDQPIEVQQVALIPHPSFAHQWWPSYDVGIIKTTENKAFKGTLALEKSVKAVSGNITVMGAGKYDLEKGLRARLTGENSFFSLGSVIFFFGVSKNSTSEAGLKVSVAPNDSGGPIIDKQSGKIIGVMTTTTVQQSAPYGLPSINTGTSTVIKTNIEFLEKHLGPNQKP